MYFTSDHVSLIADIEVFEPEKWKESSIQERIQALREYETRVSRLENRPACRVQVEVLDKPQIAGKWTEENKIFIAQDIVESSSSYEALRVLAEESHHAFQFHAVTNPGFYNESETKEWKRDFDAMKFIDPTIDPDSYKKLCIEVSAKLTAKSIVEALKQEHSLNRDTNELKQELEKVKQERLGTVENLNFESNNPHLKKEKFFFTVSGKGIDTEIVAINDKGDEKRIKLTEFIEKLPKEIQKNLIKLAEKKITSREISQTQEQQQKELPNQEKKHDRERDR